MDFPSKKMNEDKVAKEVTKYPDIDPDHDFNCPICFEVMVQPRKLICGHRFCAQCLFKTANDHVYGLQKQTVRTVFKPCNFCQKAGSNTDNCPIDIKFAEIIEKENPFHYYKALNELKKAGELIEEAPPITEKKQKSEIKSKSVGPAKGKESFLEKLLNCKL